MRKSIGNYENLHFSDRDQSASQQISGKKFESKKVAMKSYQKSTPK